MRRYEGGFPVGVVEGYPIDLERPDELDSMSIAFPELPDVMSAPLGREVMDIIKTENQFQIGSCQGQSLTSVMELCSAIATGGVVAELSRWFAYRESQIIDGISGDRGSTIAGGVRLSQEKGVCREALCPYPSRYTNTIATGDASYDELIDDAEEFKIGSSVRVRSVEQAAEWLDKGIGGIHVGCIWSNTFDPPVIETYRAGRGGHAWAILGRGDRVYDGMRSFLMLNSWGEEWINSVRGWKEISPAALDAILRHNGTSAFGLSDMKESEFVIRSFDWITRGVASLLRKGVIE